MYFNLTATHLCAW